MRGDRQSATNGWLLISLPPAWLARESLLMHTPLTATSCEVALGERLAALALSDARAL